MLQDAGQPGLFTDQLLEAIVAGDTDRLRLLASAYHAAAMAGNHKAVRLLASDSVPISAADEQCCGTVLARFTCDETAQQQLAGWNFSALGLAAWRGHASVVAALLEAGAAPDAVSTHTTR